MQDSINITENFANNFKQTVDLILDKIGINVFRGNGRYFNRAIFDAVMVGVCNSLKEGINLDNIKTNYHKLLEDESFKEYIVEGTTDKKKVKGRIELAINYFGEKDV